MITTGDDKLKLKLSYANFINLMPNEEICSVSSFHPQKTMGNNILNIVFEF